MTANTGVTNMKWLGVWIDNSSGTLTDLSNYVIDPGEHGLEFAKAVQTGIGERIENFTVGNPSAPLSIKFRYDTVVIAHFAALLTEPRVPLSIDYRHGIGHAWEAGEPTFGCTSSATSGYIVTNIKCTGEDITVDLDVFGGVAPTFSTSAHS
jgi:hypothetical protein